MTSCTNISLNELKQKLFRHENMTILDVRQVEEYRRGNIQGSVLIPLNVLSQKINTLNKHEDIVIVCWSGTRSSEACTLLKKNGFTNIKSLQGGLSSWAS